jgi:hypothetical protein
MGNDPGGFGFGDGKLFVVDNYLEAVGVMSALRAGVAVSAVRRPLAGTRVVCEREKNLCGEEKPVETTEA